MSSRNAVVVPGPALWLPERVGAAAVLVAPVSARHHCFLSRCLSRSWVARAARGPGLQSGSGGIFGGRCGGEGTNPSKCTSGKTPSRGGGVFALSFAAPGGTCLWAGSLASRFAARAEALRVPGAGRGAGEGRGTAGLRGRRRSNLSPAAGASTRRSHPPLSSAFSPRLGARGVRGASCAGFCPAHRPRPPGALCRGGKGCAHLGVRFWGGISEWAVSRGRAKGEGMRRLLAEVYYYWVAEGGGGVCRADKMRSPPAPPRPASVDAREAAGSAAAGACSPCSSSLPCPRRRSATGRSSPPAG